VRVLVTAALLSLTTACAPLALESGAVSPAGAPAAGDATGRGELAADRATRAAEAAPASTVAPTTPAPVDSVDPIAAPEPTATANVARVSSPATKVPTGKKAAGSTTGSRSSSRSGGSGSATSAKAGSTGSSTPAPARPTGVPAGPWTNTTASFSAAGYGADYRVFAEGIDTSRPVGLLVYADGTGEYGLEHPTSSYALGGAGGLAAVARAHNMVLATPFSPNRSCKCWEQGDAAGYANYLAALISRLQSQYGAQQLWFAGYSSGAQAATRFLFPAHPGLWARGGGLIAIGGGGAPAGRAAPFPASVKSNVVLRWNTGAKDTGAGGYNALSGPYGAQVGERWYAGQGFNTGIVTPAGVTHDRSGQFGSIVASFLG
jgi:hypothetical protein